MSGPTPPPPPAPLPRRPVPAAISTPEHHSGIAHSRPWQRPLTAAVAAAVALFVLGFLAETRWVTAADLRLDQGLAAGRSPALTTIAVLATTLAQPVVGAAATVLIPLVLALRRRLAVGLRVAALIGGSLALALVAKAVVAEDRPPAALAAVGADSGFGYPSGHATVAAALVAALIMLSPAGPWRRLMIGVGLAFAGLVGWSRVYLGVHYLPDILGSYLTVAAAALLVHAAWTHPLSRYLPAAQTGRR